MKTFSTIFTVILVIILNRNSYSQNINTSELNKNYNVVLFPNNTDVVGEVIGLDKHNLIKRITNLTITAAGKSVIIGDYTDTRNFSWNFLFSFLGANPLYGVNANLGGKNKVIKKISYQDTKQYNMDLLKADSLIRVKNGEINRLTNDMDLQGMKFYLIIENITATTINYGLTKTPSTTDTISVKLKQITQIKPQISFDDNKDYQISYKLPQELSVLYVLLPLKINNTTSNLVGDKMKFSVDSKKPILLKQNFINE